MSLTIVRSSFSVGMMTEIGIAMTRQPVNGLFGLSRLFSLSRVLNLIETNQINQINKTNQIRPDRRVLLGAFFWFVKHEIHDDHHGGPKQYLLVPKEDFPIVKEDGCEHERAADDAVADGRVFDN